MKTINTTNTKQMADPPSCTGEKDKQAMKKRNLFYKSYLFIILFLLLSPLVSLHAQTTPQTGDLAYGGIVVDYNPTTKNLLVMSLDEVKDDWNDAHAWANNYQKDGYTDWSLPELDQLNIIFNNKSALNKKLSDSKLSGNSYYWSGSELNGNSAWDVLFSDHYGLLTTFTTKGVQYLARAVRVLSLNNLTIPSYAVIGEKLSSTTTNTLAFNNLDGDGKTLANYAGGTIAYSAGNTEPSGVNNKSIKQSDFVDFANGNYLLAPASNLRSGGSANAIPKAYQTALNGIHRILGNKTDIGAYQSAKELSIGWVKISSKAYDGTTTASIDLTSIILTGVEDGDKVSIDLSQITATFASKDGGNDIKVDVKGTFGITGVDAHNYILAGQPDVSNLKANITKAKLKVTARGQKMPFGTDPPSTLTLSGAYDIEGFKNQEGGTALGDKPTVKIANTITSTSPVGAYPGAVLVSGATANNYDFEYVAGDLTIEQNTGSYLTFPTISNDKKYGGANFNLTSTHGLGKPIRYESSDGTIVRVNDDGSNNWTATILKPGDVTLTAIFDGDDDVAGETEEQTLNIGKAALTITANNVERKFGEPNPVVSNNYTVNTWVNDADAATFATAPKVKIDDSYGLNTSAGSYADAVIFETEGVHSFYDITHAKGTLIIKQATGAISNTNLPSSLSYGDNSAILTGTHAGGNEVKFKSDNPTIVQIGKKDGKWIATALKPGSATLTAYTEASANHQAAEVTQTLTVSKAGLSIRPDDVSRKYGEANPTFNVSVNGLKFTDTKADLGTIAVATTADVNSLVGNYELVATGAANDNYAFTYNKGKLHISKATPTITLIAGTATYTGGDLNISPAQTSGIVGTPTLAITYEYTKGSATTSSAKEAGNYQVVAKLAGDGNHADATSQAVNFTVNKANITITMAPKSVNHTGSPIQMDYSVSGGTATKDNLTFSAHYKGIEGSSYNSSTPPSDAGKYQVTISTLGDKNHNTQSNTGELSIVKNSVTLSLIDGNFLYDGTGKTLTASITPVLPVGYTYVGILTDGTHYPLSNQAPTQAGVYTVTAGFAGNDSYTATSISATLTINRIDAEIKLKSKSTPYTGSPISIDPPTTIPANALLTFTYTKQTRMLTRNNTQPPTNVGRYQVEALFAGDNNYNPKRESATLEITSSGAPAMSMVKKEVSYNGNPQAIDDAIITDALAAQELGIASYTYSNASYDPTTTAPTDAGIYNVTARTTTNTNYPIAGTASATLTIHKAEQVITFDNSQLQGKAYGDSPFDLVGTSSANFPVSFESANTSIATIVGNKVTIHQVGSVMLTAKQQGDKNYNKAPLVSHTLTIGKVSPTITLIAGTATYTGGDLTISPAQTSGIIVGTPTLAITYEYTKDGATTSSAKEAGSYQVVAKLAGDGNHADATSQAVNFTVHKATVIIGLTAKSVHYTGQPITIDAPNFSGSATASNLTFSTTYKGIGTTTYPESTQAPTAPGTYSVTVSTTGDKNHGAATSTVTLTISQSGAVITLTDKLDFVYDGSTKTLTATSNPIGLPITYAYEGKLMDGTVYPSTAQAPKDAGNYKVKASFAGDNNYTPSEEEANLTINKAQSSISLQSKSVTHTGSPIAIDKPVTIPADGLVTITYTKLTRSLLRGNTEAPSNVGTYQVEAKLAESNNYLSFQATAKLEIVEAGIPTLTFQNKEVVYTGSPQAIGAATITGPGNAADELTLSYSYQGTDYPATDKAPTDAGEYLVTATTSTNGNFSKAGSSTATLTIKKAEQTITFDEAQLQGIMLGDAPFTLTASSTSNLSVSFVSGNPDIASIAGTTITIHQSNTVMITAMQAGDKNYNAAAMVTLPLHISSDDTSIHELKINDKVHEDISRRYVVPQNYTAPTLPLSLTTEENATVIGFPATADVSKPSLQTIKFSIKAQDGTSIKNYELEIEKRFDFDALIVTRWNNTLTVINNATQHGFTFTAYQWYKNGQAIPGATKQSFSAGKNGEFLDSGDDYYVEVTDAGSSKVLRCWESKPKLRSMNIVAYPNPVLQSEILTLEADIDEEYLEGATVFIYNSIGMMVRKQKVTGRSTQIDMSVGVGTYILQLTGTKGFNTNLKLIVK